MALVEEQVVIASADVPPLPDDIAPGEPRIELAQCDSDAVVALREQLGLDPLVAQTLVRRGIGEPRLAREFIEADRLEDPAALPGAAAACRVIATHVTAGDRIAVHGDYDVDGVCSTAILVRTLTRLGADVTWHVPSRFDDGYGLSRTAIDRLAGDDVRLIVAVDCGITAISEIEHARALGVGVVICDHHAPGERLPDVPIVHPALGDYPCPELCAAAATFKLCQLLVAELERDPAMIDDEIELVGLATVCDVVALRGENRALVKRGIAAMRSSLRPGLRELIRAAGVDQLTIDAATFGFRLGPRINAAGRMFSAEPAVELMLTTDTARAAELATGLNAANARRREIEQSILFAAETQAREQRDRFAIVVSGEGWHPGVLGIVAGRIAERFRRPCIALNIEKGVAAGSGRGGGVFDLLAGLGACATHLTRYGGHKAAAGLELEASALAAFADDFRAHAATVLAIDDLRPRVRVDAIADPGQLTLATAEALAALGPFGMGNPEPAILVPAVSVADVKRMGDRRQHLRLGVVGFGGRVGVVAFGWDRVVAHGADAPLSNIVVKLKPNEFRGTVEAQARMVAHAEVAIGDPPAGDWLDAFQAALDAPPIALASGEHDAAAGVDRRFDTPLATIAEFAEQPDVIAVYVNEPELWRERMAAIAAIDPRLARIEPVAFGVADGDPVEHAVLAEPPLAPGMVAAGATRTTLAWNDSTLRSVTARATDLLLDRAHVVAVYKALRSASDESIGTLTPLLRAVTPSARIAALAVRTLVEVEVARVVRAGESVKSISIVNQRRTELDRSETFRSYSELKAQSQRWLNQLTADSPGG
ncbi:MAG: single-stranded-DNA-specific exonuclease RecJ [Solirubrobacterales bacterium]